MAQRNAERSEEHTSELQSPCKIVCRHRLEKKNKTPRFYLAFDELLELRGQRHVHACNLLRTLPERSRRKWTEPMIENSSPGFVHLSRSVPRPLHSTALGPNLSEVENSSAF